MEGGLESASKVSAEIIGLYLCSIYRVILLLFHDCSMKEFALESKLDFILKYSTP